MAWSACDSQQDSMRQGRNSTTSRSQRETHRVWHQSFLAPNKHKSSSEQVMWCECVHLFGHGMLSQCLISWSLKQPTLTGVIFSRLGASDCLKQFSSRSCLAEWAVWPAAILVFPCNCCPELSRKLTSNCSNNTITRFGEGGIREVSKSYGWRYIDE